ncbi:MAG: hypothetical protein IPK07_08280 [Deltaproteobacteria bacterium]|nr:hypothetical protein [Deltaproteobacteria bacterium]
MSSPLAEGHGRDREANARVFDCRALPFQVEHPLGALAGEVRRGNADLVRAVGQRDERAEEHATPRGELELFRVDTDRLDPRVVRDVAGDEDAVEVDGLGVGEAIDADEGRLAVEGGVEFLAELPADLVEGRGGEAGGGVPRGRARSAERDGGGGQVRVEGRDEHRAGDEPPRYGRRTAPFEDDGAGGLVTEEVLGAEGDAVVRGERDGLLDPKYGRPVSNEVRARDLDGGEPGRVLDGPGERDLAASARHDVLDR